MRRAPAEDYAPPSQIIAPDCDPEELYYGLHDVHRDPTKARQCALRRLKSDPGNSDGLLMLSVIYANGVGGRRDLDLALRYACGLGPDAVPELRVQHLAALSIMRAEHWSGQDYDFADLWSGTAWANTSALHQAGIADSERADRLAALTARWPAKSRRALAILLAAREDWSRQAGEEIYHVGTGWTEESIEVNQAVRTDFLDLLTSIDGGKLPPASAAETRAADVAMDKALNVLLTCGSRSCQLDDATAERDEGQFRRGQAAWVRYRAAWVAFVHIHAPGVAPQRVSLWLTRKRTERLTTYAG